METEIIKILTEAGSLGIVIALLIYLAWRDKLFNKTLNNHLEHSRETDEKLTEAITGLKGVIKGCKYNNLNKK